MDFVVVYQLALAVVKELWRFRYAALLSAFAIAVAFLGLGAAWQEKYETRATVYADYQNIISPLLEGQAQVIRVSDQLLRVRDIMLSQKALETIVDQEEGLVKEGAGLAERSVAIESLREAIDVRGLSQDYVAISYKDPNPDRSYSIVTTLLNLFLKESSENKRSESRQAFEFIEKQAAAYEEQLRVADEKLKAFNASNLDGTAGQAQSAIEEIRQNIEVVQLDLEQARERAGSLQSQVDKEDRYLTAKARSDGYNERIAQAVAQLDELRLSYTDSHPDVIAMKDHISALREASASGIDPAPAVSNKNDVENPVYDKLRTALASAVVERDSIQRRLNSLKVRLAESRQRLQRIIARDAEFKELTRDYDVTKGLYEDLLQRKEKARLSMTLDIEGQGVTYKVQEPPEFPLLPSGLRFIHFVAIGCVLAVAFPVGLAVLYVLLDPRIRFSSTLRDSFDIPILAEVPHYSSSLQQRLSRVDARVYIFFASLAAAIYLGLLFSYVIIFR